MSVEEAARVPPMLQRRMTRKERQEQAERVQRFLALPPELQEGMLRYAENIRSSYGGGPISTKRG